MSKLFLLSEEEAIEEIKQVRFNLNCQLNGTSRFEEAFEMAIKALKQIKKIKSIINGPVCMQGYVPKYMDICEVLEDKQFMRQVTCKPYRDYTFLKEHCYKILRQPLVPDRRNEYLAILDLIEFYEEHQERSDE